MRVGTEGGGKGGGRGLEVWEAEMGDGGLLGR
jgi:hypothetical protein